MVEHDVLVTTIVEIIGLFPAIGVVWAVLTRSKTVASLAQLGHLQGRELAQEEYEAAKESITEAEARRVRMLGGLYAGHSSHIVHPSGSCGGRRLHNLVLHNFVWQLRTRDKVSFTLGVMNT